MLVGKAMQTFCCGLTLPLDLHGEVANGVSRCEQQLVRHLRFDADGIAGTK